jgi:hypothetical protein
MGSSRELGRSEFERMALFRLMFGRLHHCREGGRSVSVGITVNPLMFCVMRGGRGVQSVRAVHDGCNYGGRDNTVPGTGFRAD